MQWELPTAIFARQALTTQGWQSDVLVHLKDRRIAAIENNASAPSGIATVDLLLPGMGNVHSHAFQRAMVGLTETPSASGKSNFWSWREVMYDFVLQLSPDQLQAVAQHFYIELLKQGYTTVGEFHYVHHDPDGRPYANPAELSLGILAAAREAGIRLTHLPVLYETANVGGVTAQHDQRRFIHTIDDYLRLIESLVPQQNERVTLGVAPHSLRAVHPESLQKLLQALPSMGLADCPVHIHAAEQEKEVEDCIAATGERPVEWLLNHAAIDARWCLIHATHMTDDETKRFAASGAVAGLCPTTEANLGDGIFPTRHFLDAGGAFGVGSDSNVCVNPFEELRMLEYNQRLFYRQRNVLAANASTGRNLFTKAATGGAQALGIDAGRIAVGARADLVAFDLDTPLLADKTGEAVLDTLIFGYAHLPVCDVWVGGSHVVTQGRHAGEERASTRFKQVMQQLKSK